MNANAITCEDRVTMIKFQCNKYQSFIYNCSFCGTPCDFCKDRKAANRHRRKKQRGAAHNDNTIEGNDVGESNKVITSFTGGF